MSIQAWERQRSGRVHRALRVVAVMALIGTLVQTGVSMAAEDTAKQKAYLEQLRKILPDSQPWEAWLAESGELPPDFEALPSVQGLPDPLINEDGSAVETPAAWAARREELKALFLKWVLGSVAPAPENLEARVLGEKKEAGVTVREVELRFGPEHKAKMWCEVFIPDGEGPFPVFMTQHNHRSWALIALQRGYLSFVYAGSDSRDDTGTFLEAYPEYEWSKLTRRAWAAGRCIDYLEASVPQADMKRIALTGHSRNGKLSLIASALDERIAAVISSSSGTGGSLASRYCSEQHFGEGIENITRVFPDWFHPRWRFFVGREDRLPVDLHELVAMSAPRPCLLSIAINDGVESAWAMEETYLSAKRVYSLLGEEDKIGILWRSGGHETWPTTIEQYVDWCDVQFGRGGYAFSERLIYPHDWEAWRAQSGEEVSAKDLPVCGLDDVLKLKDGASVSTKRAWPGKRDEVRAAVKDMLGEAPPKAVNPRHEYGTEKGHVERLLNRDGTPPSIVKEDLVFGEYINADVYRNKDTVESKAKLPVILWLHPVNSCQGYVAAYRRGEQGFFKMARAGYCVFGYDQIGYGRRVEEVEGFYTRYPRWSLLGKMVRDAQSALDAIGTLEYADQDNIWVVGFGLGAMVGSHLCALDDRPAGFVSVCGPAPFRLDTGDATGGGMARWSHRYLFAPRMGFFVGEEGRLPYDIHLLTACVAPKPVCFVTPELDREAPVALMTKSIEAARPAFDLLGKADDLVQLTPEDYPRWGPEMQKVVIDWLKGAVK